MKAQTRMIVASVIVIAFALTAVSGVTYSWFSDTEQAEIDITAGKVDFGLNIASFTDKTGSGAATQAVSDGITYGFGLSAKVSYNSMEENTAKISMERLADRDSLKIDFKITNNSTIKTIYRVSASPSGTLTQYLQNEFTVGGETYSDCTGWLPASVPTAITSDIEGSLIITMDSGGKANNINGDKAATIILKVEAYQANTESSDLPAYHVVQTVAANETISKTFTNTETTVVDSTGVEFEASAEGDYTIGSITAAVDGSYTIAQTAGDDQKEKTVITGISVNATKNSKEVDLKDQTAIIRFVLNESVLNTEKTALKGGYSIYHQSEGTVTALTLSKVVASPSSEGQYTLEKIGETSSYAMDVYVKGFSAYYLVIDANAIVDGEYVKMTTETDETNVETILNSASKAILLDNLSYEDTYSWQLTSDLVLDLNGHTISFNGCNALGFSGNLKVIGTATGSGMSSNQAPLFYFHGKDASLTIDGGTYKSTEDSVIWGQGKDLCEGARVTISSGTFTGNKNVVYLWEGDLTINGGSFTNHGTGDGRVVTACIEVLGGNLTINGGVFQTTDVNVIQHMSDESSGTGKLTINGGSFNATFNGSTCFILDLYKGTTEINGGKFNLTAGSYGAVISLGTGAMASISDGSFKISDGSFDTIDGEKFLSHWNFIRPSTGGSFISEEGQLSVDAEIIRGGTFNIDPSKISYHYLSESYAKWSFVANDYESNDNGDGTFTVELKKTS